MNPNFLSVSKCKTYLQQAQAMVEDTLNYGLSTVAEQTALPFGLILYNSNNLKLPICTLA
jgi:hypothetical protein